MPYLLDRLKKAGITGIDVNKPDKPKVPEMGGLAAIIDDLVGLSKKKKAIYVMFASVPLLT